MSGARVLAGNPNCLGDRETMGLPESFVARLPAVILAEHRDLLRAEQSLLLAVTEDPTAPFARRYAAGTVLGLTGDPRVRPFDPPMQTIPAARVRLGLDCEQVARVVAQWQHVGVMESWIAKECPSYVAQLGEYAMMRYPVTNLEFRLFLEQTDSRWLPTSWRFGAYPAELANHPVWSIPPEAADAYAEWFSSRGGRDFRLPTEAEWEYAASGCHRREYPWGDRFDPQAANTVELGPLTTTPIGIFPSGRSLFGIDDLAGNVEEYVADRYHAYPGGVAIDDDLARAQGAYRIARGGSFTRFGDLTRCTRRHGWYQRDIYAVGFRLVESR